METSNFTFAFFYKLTRLKDRGESEFIFEQCNRILVYTL